MTKGMEKSLIPVRLPALQLAALERPFACLAQANPTRPSSGIFPLHLSYSISSSAFKF
jgi:hypothetical protein